MGTVTGAGLYQRRAWRGVVVAIAAILGVRRDLNEFRLKVAEEYASREHLREVELRLLDATNKLSDKFEALPSKKNTATTHPPND